MNKHEVFVWAADQFGTEPEYLWRSAPDYAVLRNPAGKWYAIVMNVPRCRLAGQSGDDPVDVLNVKVSPLMLGSLLEQKGFLPAYHMSKKSWVSILLDGSVDGETIKALLEMSYDLSLPKKTNQSHH